MRPRDALLGLCAALAALAIHATAGAAPVEPSPPAARPREVIRRPAVLLPTALAEGGARRLPGPADRTLGALAGSLDALLADAAQDLGLDIDLTGRAAAGAEALDDSELPERARAVGRILVVPSVAERDGAIEIRLALAQPGARTLRLRVEQTSPDDAEVRAAVMLRDLVADLAPAPTAGRPEQGAPTGVPAGAPATPVGSAGRSALVVNATLYGGVVGYSIQASSGSDDPRLLYPLLAVGAGVGLGGSIIIAEEWDVGVGDAWFLSAGAWWPTLAGHLIYEGRFAARAGDQDGERWAFGLVGGTAGLTMATLGLALRPMGDGGALLAHSGGGLGFVLGGLAEIATTGDIEATPFTGAGYGAALGWLAAAATATQARIAPSRVLALDLGALLGGLGGAALASPLLFDAPTPGEQRAWVGATASGLVLGAGLALFFTKPPAASAETATTTWWRAGLPRIGVVGESVIGRRRAPAFGLSWSGTL